MVQQTTDPTDLVRTAYEAQRQAFSKDPYPSFEQRRGWLKSLAAMVRNNKAAIVDAIHRDFGSRADVETLGAEILVVDGGISYLLKNLRRFMAVEDRHISMLFAPAKGQVVVQPKGVVGILSPWNYPIQLALVPLATALAAGNRVLLKPSELSPYTSELLQRLLHETFPRDLVTVLLGGVEVAVPFSKTPFDHLFYTGSTGVGRLVMKAAAENLTPVTLELGGKSPAIIHRNADLQLAIERIAFGKAFNAGQTCVAVDYVLVPRERQGDFIQGLLDAFRKFYPTIAENPDYTSIINSQHYERILTLLNDAVEKGAVAIPSCDEPLKNTRKIAPTIVKRVSDQMDIMRDEIFGPLLPIVPYDSIEEAMAYVNARPRPLALYYFDSNQRRIDRVLHGTHSGSVCVNDTILHVAQDDLPFGGIGPSGMGAYHGREGFLTFSHSKAVFYQRKLRFTILFNPPYGRAVRTLLRTLLGR